RPLEYAGVGDADLADLVHRTFLQDPAIGVRVQDADVAIGQWNANRSDLLAAIHRVAGDKTGRLGQAIAFGDLHAGRLLEPVVEFERQGRRARDRDLERGDVGVDRALHQRGDGRGNRDQEGHAPAL